MKPNLRGGRYDEKDGDTIAVMGVLVTLFARAAVAKVINGNGGDNKLIGTPNADTIRGFGGEDLINDRAGADTLVGGSGDDNIYGSYSNDFVRVVDGDNDEESIVVEASTGCAQTMTMTFRAAARGLRGLTTMMAAATMMTTKAMAQMRLEGTLARCTPTGT